MQRHCRQSGFTLIEITAVLILIAAILAIVGPAYMQSLAKGRVKAAAAQISYIESILDEYKLENKAYPTTEQGLDALYTKPAAPPVPAAWNGPYAQKPIGDDPWGNPYVYKCPGERGRNGYDVWSYGADGVAGGAGVDADIGNWEEAE